MDTPFFQVPMLEFRHGAGDLYKKAQKWAPHSCEQTVFVSSGIVHCFVRAAKFMIQNSLWQGKSRCKSKSKCAHSYMLDTQGVNTTPFYADTVPRH